MIIVTAVEISSLVLSSFTIHRKLWITLYHYTFVTSFSVLYLFYFFTVTIRLCLLKLITVHHLNNLCLSLCFFNIHKTYSLFQINRHTPLLHLRKL